MTTTHTQTNITKSNGRTIGDVLQEIAHMQEYCKAHYDEGYDTMVECWSDADYEGLFYMFSLDTENPKYNSERPDARVPASQAWETLHEIAAIYADRQADARNSAF